MFWAGLGIRSLAHLLFALLLNITHFKKRPWAICSRRSLQKRNMSELLSSLFKKDWCEWFSRDSSKSLAKNEWFHEKFVFLYVLVFPRFIPKSESLRSFLKSDLSDSLRLLIIKEQLCVICSGCSWQKSNCERFAQVTHDKRAKGVICSFSQANCSFAHKTS